MISLRPAHHTDFDAVAEMMKEFTAQHHRWQPDQFRPTVIGFTVAIFQTWLEKPNELHLVAEMDGKVAGYAGAARWAGEGTAFTYARRGVFIFYMVVAAEQRRKGIGRALFRAIEDWAAEFNAEYIGLHVAAANEPAKAFYTSLGYEPDGEHRAKTLRRVTRVSAP